MGKYRHHLGEWGARSRQEFLLATFGARLASMLTRRLGIPVNHCILRHGVWVACIDDGGEGDIATVSDLLLQARTCRYEVSSAEAASKNEEGAEEGKG